MSFSFLRPASLGAALFLLLGCGAPAHKEIRGNIDATVGKAKAEAVEFEAPPAPGALVVEDSVWLGPGGVPFDRERSLPDHLGGKEFSIRVRARGTTRLELMEIVERQLGVRFEYVDFRPRDGEGEGAPVGDLVNQDTGRALNQPSREERREDYVEDTLRLWGRLPLPRVWPGWNSDQPLDRNFRWDGDAAGLLDKMVSEIGLASWKVDDVGRGAVTVIALQSTEVREFPLHVLIPAGAGITGGGAGEGGAGGDEGGIGGGATVRAGDQLYLEAEGIWDEVENAVRSICGADCAVERHSGLGMFVVSGQPKNLDRVGDYMERVNKGVLEQILVDVEIYEIRRNAQDRFSFDLALLAYGAGKDLGLALGSPSSTAAEIFLNTAGEEGERWTVEDADGSVRLETDEEFYTRIDELAEDSSDLGGGDSSLSAGVTLLNPKGPLATNSSAFLDTLSTQGQASLVRAASFIMGDGRQQKFRTLVENEYSQGQETTTQREGEGAGASSQTTQGQAETATGVDQVDISVLARLLPGGRVLLGYDIRIDQDIPQRGLVQNPPPGATIRSQAKDDLVSEIAVPLGSRLVLTAFESAMIRGDDTGVGAPGFWLLGGGFDKASEVRTLVVSIRPVRIDFPFRPSGGSSGEGF